MTHLKIIILIAGLLSAPYADAHYKEHHSRPVYHHHAYGDRISERQQQQQRRIEGGLYRGQLTPREFQSLNSQQYRIDKLEHRFKRDGWLSRAEQRILENRLARASRHIEHLKHNNRYPGRGYDYYGYNNY